MYSILRAGKLKTRSEITNAAEHNLRLRTQPNIDQSRTAANRVYVDPFGTTTVPNAGHFQRSLSAFYEEKGAKERKNSVLALEFVLSASPEFFEDPGVDVNQWAQVQVDFMRREFGENLKFGVLHLDEKTPHMHFFVSTDETKETTYKNQHGTFSKPRTALNARRWGPAFLEGLHTRHAQANARFGLKRGRKGSERLHKPLKEYYNDLTAAMEDAKQVQRQAARADRLTKVLEYMHAALETLLGIARQNPTLTEADQATMEKIERVSDKVKKTILDQNGGAAPKPPVLGGGGKSR